MLSVGRGLGLNENSFRLRGVGGPLLGVGGPVWAPECGVGALFRGVDMPAGGHDSLSLGDETGFRLDKSTGQLLRVKSGASGFGDATGFG